MGDSRGPLNISNADGAQSAFSAINAPGGTKPATGQPAAYIYQADSTGTAVLARGDGTLLDLQGTSTTSKFKVDSSGNVTTAGTLISGAITPTVTTLTFAGTVAVNAALGNVFALTLTASTATLGAPSNPVNGQAIRIRVIQDSTGGWTLAYNAVYDFGTAGSPTLSTGASKVDILGFEYVASLVKWCYLGSGLGF